MYMIVVNLFWEETITTGMACPVLLHWYNLLSIVEYNILDQEEDLGMIYLNFFIQRVI